MRHLYKQTDAFKLVVKNQIAYVIDLVRMQQETIAFILKQNQ